MKISFNFFNAFYLFYSFPERIFLRFGEVDRVERGEREVAERLLVSLGFLGEDTCRPSLKKPIYKIDQS